MKPAIYLFGTLGILLLLCAPLALSALDLVLAKTLMALSLLMLIIAGLIALFELAGDVQESQRRKIIEDVRRRRGGAE
jgi:hypothetical protein